MIYLRDRFIPFGKESLNEDKVKHLWSPVVNANVPPFKLFFKNFNFEDLKQNLGIKKSEFKIDPSKLNEYFFLSDSSFIHRNPRKTFLSISYPIFNRNMDWAIMVKSYYTPYYQAGANGLLYIYTKVDGKWVLYHKFDLWLS